MEVLVVLVLLVIIVVAAVWAFARSGSSRSAPQPPHGHDGWVGTWMATPPAHGMQDTMPTLIILLNPVTVILGAAGPVEVGVTPGQLLMAEAETKTWMPKGPSWSAK